MLLASTRSAGLGLNLTCASRVVVLDVWWNGASEDQVRTLRTCRWGELCLGVVGKSVVAPSSSMQVAARCIVR